MLLLPCCKISVADVWGPSRPQDGRCPETSSLPDSPNTLHLPRPVPVRAELSTASAITSLHQPLCNTSNCTCDDSERFSLRLSWLVILLEFPAGPHHAIGVQLCPLLYWLPCTLLFFFLLQVMNLSIHLPLAFFPQIFPTASCSPQMI